MTFKDVNFNIAMYGTEAVTQTTYPLVYTGDESSIQVNFTVTDELDLTGATAILHLYFADSSHIEKVMALNGLVFSYLLTGTQNDHAGIVRADIFITKDGAKYTKAGYRFKIDTSLEANATIIEYAVDTLDAVVDNAEEWLLQAQTDFGVAQGQRAAEWIIDNDVRDDAFDAAQTLRENTFDAGKLAREAAFNLSESGRSNTFTVNENARQEAADANEVARDGSYEVSEGVRDGKYDSEEAGRNGQYTVQELARNNQYGVAEAARDAEYGVAEVTRNDLFEAADLARSEVADGDHNIAGTDHAIAVADTGRALTDHNTAASDHTTAVSDHGVALTDHGTANTDHSGYVADHGIAAADHTTAVTDHGVAGTDHTTAISDHSTAQSDHTTNLADHAIVGGYNTRLTAEEMATAANKISAVKGKTFADVDARFEDLEVDTTLIGTNAITNGDFLNGTTGWTAGTATVSASSNELTAVNATTGYQTVISPTITSVGGHSYYVAANVKTTSSTVGLQFTNSVNYASDKLHTGGGAYERLSVIYKHPTGYSTCRVAIYGTNTTWYVKNIICIDLTATFGAGNEPTVEQMDAIMAKFTNSWFNGTANLFRANTTLNKLMAVDARTKFESKNLVINSSMLSDGNADGLADGWNKYQEITASLIASGDVNIQRATVTGVVSNTAVALSQTFNVSTGKKYYACAYARYVNTPVNYNGLRIGNTSPTGTEYYYVNLTGTLTRYSTIITTTNTNLYMGIIARDPGDSAEIKNVGLICLTDVFGSGKEPTLAEMDRLMARYPNSWFDGTKPIQTIESLYQEKANKVQEAWITPTLTNAWVAFDTRTAKYKKTEFGRVYLKGIVKSGTIGSAIFTLPVGYRPDETLTYAIVSNGAFGYVTINTDGTVICTLGSNVSVSLSGISFFI
jgi:hypothetical protein